MMNRRFWRIATAGALLLAGSCAGPPPVARGDNADPEIAQSTAAGLLAYERGELSLAMTLFGRSLMRGRATNSPGAIADAAYNLAVCELESGDDSAAAARLSEAEFDAGRAGADTGDVVLLEAKLACRRGAFDQASQLIHRVLQSHPTATQAASAQLLQGRMFCDQANLDGAQLEVREVAGLERSLPASLRAELADLRGSIALRRNDAPQASDQFAAAAELFRVAHRYRDMTQALARAGEASLATNRFDVAADRLFVAARSAAAQGNIKAARRLLALSESAAERAGGAAARERAQTLSNEINGASVPSADTSQFPPPP